MSDFSDRPFVAGSLVGLRAFDVDALGRLIGPYIPQVFKPEENVAECRKGDFRGPFTSFLSSTIFVDGPQPVAETKTVKAKVHAVSGLACSCGFYAYFDGRNDYDSDERIAAIVEGYGVCTVGSRGFRAEKARLLALVIPSSRFDWFHRLARWSENRMGAGGAVLGFLSLLASLAIGLAGTAESSPFWAGMFLLTGLSGVLLAASFHGITCKHTPNRWAAVRRNYADVPVFRSTRAALAAFPLTAPPKPTPETCEDFWTRSAR